MHMYVLIYNNVITSRAFNKRRKPLVVTHIISRYILHTLIVYLSCRSQEIVIVSEQLNPTMLGQVFPSINKIVQESILVTTHKQLG